MKVIPLNEAIKLLEQCSAVIWGKETFLSRHLVNSEETDEPEHTFLYLSADEAGLLYEAQFQDCDNKMVSIIGNKMFLYDTNHHKTEIELLVPKTL